MPGRAFRAGSAHCGCTPCLCRGRVPAILMISWVAREGEFRFAGVAEQMVSVLPVCPRRRPSPTTCLDGLACDESCLSMRPPVQRVVSIQMYWYSNVKS